LGEKIGEGVKGGSDKRGGGDSIKKKGVTTPSRELRYEKNSAVPSNLRKGGTGGRELIFT